MEARSLPPLRGQPTDVQPPAPATQPAPPARATQPALPDAVVGIDASYIAGPVDEAAQSQTAAKKGTLALVFEGAIVGGRGKSLRPELALGAELEMAGNWPFAVRAVAWRTLSGELAPDAGTATFRLLGGRLMLAPRLLTLTPWLTATVWTGVEVAALAGQGKLVHRGEAAVPWASWSVASQLRIEPARALVVGVTAGFQLPITPYRFWFETPDQLLYETPRLSGFVGFSASAQFFVIR